MGLWSTAKLPTNTPFSKDNPKKVDTPYEIALCLYATLYDARDKLLLTREKGKFKKASLKTLAGRLFVIKQLCFRYGYLHLVNFVEKAKDIVALYLSGKINRNQYLQLIRHVSYTHLTLPTICSV